MKGKIGKVYFERIKGDITNIDKYNYLWTTKKDEYALVNTRYGYGIVNKKEQSVLSISDEILEEEVIKKMLSEGIKIYDNILDAYSDV